MTLFYPIRRQNTVAICSHSTFYSLIFMKVYYDLPGDIQFSPELKEQLQSKRNQLGGTYVPRTGHLDETGWARYTNRLFLESSPYLMQHAHNPVNWFPWGEEAFNLAQETDRPVLVSIGYSTCHWCHVMEEESFEDLEIAEYLNRHFIPIKVDREERPDIDSVYMSAIQLLTGSGGWPLNVWLTPQKKPFWGGTYFPARDGDRGTSTGFLDILKKLDDIYRNNRSTVIQSGRSLENAVQKILVPQGGDTLPEQEMMENAIAYYKNQYDRQYGGLLGAPKFPSSLPLRLLFRYYRQRSDKDCLDMAAHTLSSMASGGIHDHVGGGFHRYSVDERWLVPHFEKMSYDNALLVLAFLEGYQITGNEEYRATVYSTLDFIERDLLSPEGGFYAAIDADSLTPDGHRQEGYYYTWPYDELTTRLSDDEFRLLSGIYTVSKPGNFEGRNILHIPFDLKNAIQSNPVPSEDFQSRIRTLKDKLLAARNQRPLPITDTKLLTAWNGLIISAYARAGFILNNEKYLQIASRAAGFIQDRLLVDSVLYRCYSNGMRKNPAFLEDYAFFTAGLLDLFEGTQKSEWLESAVKLDKILKEQFEDRLNGGFYAAGMNQEKLIAREKPYYDGATPSGNSVAMMNLLRLSGYSGKRGYIERFEKAVRFFLGGSQINPAAVSEMMLAVDSYLDKPMEIVIVIPDNGKNEPDAFLDILRRHFLPNKSLIITKSHDLERLSHHIPFLSQKQVINDSITAYVCEEGTCYTPATTPAEFEKELKRFDLKNPSGHLEKPAR